ncbi:MAG: DUF368 domain-containing protein, partial [Clostridia bacterium]|nr:DUF368 domain-containing protein [Clostridia bacterium]
MKDTGRKRLFWGLLIGFAALAPGISGGAIAVCCGLYGQAVQRLGALRQDPLGSLRWLLPLGVGGVAGAAMCTGVLAGFFTRFQAETVAVL